MPEPKRGRPKDVCRFLRVSAGGNMRTGGASRLRLAVAVIRHPAPAGRPLMPILSVSRAYRDCKKDWVSAGRSCSRGTADIDEPRSKNARRSRKDGSRSPATLPTYMTIRNLSRGRRTQLAPCWRPSKIAYGGAHDQPAPESRSMKALWTSASVRAVSVARLAQRARAPPPL